MKIDPKKGNKQEQEEPLPEGTFFPKEFPQKEMPDREKIDKAYRENQVPKEKNNLKGRMNEG